MNNETVIKPDGLITRLIMRAFPSDVARRLAGPGLAALIIKMAGAVLGYFMLVAFAWLLSPEDYGRFGLILNLSLVIGAVASLGLPTGILRLWPEYLVKGAPGMARGAMLQSMIILAAAGAVAVALAAGLGFLDVGAGITGSQFGLMIAAILAVCTAFADFLSNALRALNHTIWSMAPRDIFWRIFSPALAGLLLYATGQLSAAMASLATTFIMACIVAVQLYKTLKATQLATAGAPARSDWVHWWRFLWPVWALTLLYAMIQQLDVVLIGSLVGAADAGAYFAAQKTANLLGLAMLAGGLVAAPMMAAAFHGGRLDELRRLCRFLSIAIAATTGAGLLILVFFGNHLLAIFDPAYMAAYPVLLVLSLGYTIDSLAGPNSYLMQMTGLERPFLVIMLVVYAIVVTLQIIFIPHYGMMAAAAANALGSILWNCAAIVMLRKRAGIDPSVLSLLRSRQV